MEPVSVTEPQDRELATWARAGIAAGLVACIVYPVAVFVPIPSHRLTVLLGGAFGPSLALAGVAMGRVLRARGNGVAAELGGVSSALAGALVTAMIVVQLAVNYSTATSAGEPLKRFVVMRVWDVVLGLDVAFDMFIGLGTTLFGLCMLRDRRFGPVLGWTGIVIGTVVILGFNVWTFPMPPRDAGLFDPGPITGVWYLAVIVMMMRSLRRKRGAGGSAIEGRVAGVSSTGSDNA